MELTSLVDFQQDEEYFLNNLQRIRRKHKGKYVLIKNREVMFSGKTFKDIEKKAEKANIDLATSVVEFVPEADVVILF